jgi:hypothetical protein
MIFGAGVVDIDFWLRCFKISSFSFAQKASKSLPSPSCFQQVSWSPLRNAASHHSANRFGKAQSKRTAQVGQALAWRPPVRYFLLDVPFLDKFNSWDVPAIKLLESVRD